MQDDDLDNVSPMKVQNEKFFPNKSSPLQLHPTQPAPVKRQDHRAVTSFPGKGDHESSSMQDSPMLVNNVMKSKDDQAVDEFNIGNDIVFMDEDTTIKATHITRLPQRMYVYFQEKGDILSARNKKVIS